MYSKFATSSRPLMQERRARFLTRPEINLHEIPAELFEKIKNIPEDKAKQILGTMSGPYEEIEKLMEKCFDDGCVRKLVLRNGTGAQVEDGNLISVKYMVGLEKTDELVGSTYNYKPEWPPSKFRVGAGECIGLLDYAFSTMKVGEVAKFLGIPELAFGQKGEPDMGVPPGCRAMVQIEVLETTDKKPSDGVEFMSPCEREEDSFEDFYARLLAVKANRERMEREERARQAEDFESPRNMLLRALRQWFLEKEERMHPLSVQSLTCVLWKKREETGAVFRDVLSVERGEGEGIAEFHYRCAKSLLDFGDADRAYDYIIQVAKEMPVGLEDEVKQLQMQIEKEMMEGYEQRPLSELLKEVNLEGEGNTKEDDGSDDEDNQPNCSCCNANVNA